MARHVSDLHYQIDQRLGDGNWQPMSLGSMNEIQATQKLAALQLAMPLKEFQIVSWTDEDIPF